MSWINWIPIAGTIDNAASDPKGTKVSDYTCTMNRSACGEIGSEQAAILACEKIINNELYQYITDYQGGAVADQYIGVGIGGAGSVITGMILRQLIARGASGIAIGATGIGAVVLGLDAYINLSITLDNLAAMKAAADQAKATCCTCERVRCGESQGDQPVATGLTIARSYYGGSRSFRLTKEDMQKKTEDDYQHICEGEEGCTNGFCRPVAYVTDWEQSTRVFWMRTDLTYDVYCECK